MKKLLKLIFPLLYLLCACTDDVSVAPNYDDMSYFIPEDSAIAISNKAITMISNENKTRCIKKELEIKDVNLVSLSNKLKTRSGEVNNVNSSLYIINYKNDKGFSIISCDKRLRPIYAVSDTGNITLADTLKNKSLALFFNGVRSDMEMVSENSQKIDPYLLDETIYSPQVYPLIWEAPRLWGQGDPYNTYCYTKDGKKALAGCTAVACGIVMSYYGWPQYINDKRLNWHSMKKNKIDHNIDYVFAKLGEKKLLDIYYGEKASGAKAANFSRTFSQMGYYAPDKLKDFSESNICRLLEDTKRDGYGPLLIVGVTTDGTAGHTWVIDGYCRSVTNYERTKVLYDTNLFHCIWGWKGNNNGYFFLNNGVIGGCSNLYDKDDKKTSSPGYDFTRLQYMANFRIDRNRQKVNL